MILFAPFAARAHSLNGSPSPKDYPWPKQLAELLKEHDLVQIGGNGDQQIVPNFRKNLSFNDVGNLIEQSKTAICVDSYLQHHMWFLNKKAIVLWSVSDPTIFGHDLHVNLLKDRGFLRPNQFDLYYSSDCHPEAFVRPEEVIIALNQLPIT